MASSWQEYKKKHGIETEKIEKKQSAQNQEPEQKESAWQRYKRENGTPESNPYLRVEIQGRNQQRQKLQEQKKYIDSFVGPTMPGQADAMEAAYYREQAALGAKWKSADDYRREQNLYRNALQRATAGYNAELSRREQERQAEEEKLSGLYTALKRDGDLVSNIRYLSMLDRYSKDGAFLQQMGTDAARMGSYGLYDRANKANQGALNSIAGAYSDYRKEADKTFAAKMEHLKTEDPESYLAYTSTAEDVEKKLTELEQQKAEMEGVYRHYYDEWANDSTSKSAEEHEAKEKAFLDFEAKLNQVNADIEVYKKAQRYHKNQKGKALYEQYLGGGKVLDPESVKKIDEGKARYEADRQAAIAKGGETLDYGLNLIAKARGVWRGDKDRLEEAGWDPTFDTAANLTSEDENLFYALYADDPQKAMDFITYANNRRNEEYEGWMAEIGYENPLGAFSAALLERLGSGVTNYIDPHSATTNKLAIGASGLLSGGAQLLNEWSGTIDTNIPFLRDLNGKGLGDFYQLANSIVESGINAYAAGKLGEFIPGGGAEGIAALGTMIMGSSASAADYNECIKRGLTPGEAQKHALAAGINEALFEFVSMDKLIDTEKLMMADTMKDKIKAIFIQSGVEASEEFCTTVANRLADGAQARRDGYDSQIEHRAKELIALGKSRDEALEMAEKEWVTELINDAIGGFISGGLHDAGALVATATMRAVNNIRAERAMNRTYGKITSDAQQAAMRAYAADNGIAWNSTENGATVQNTQTETEGADSSPAAQNDNEGRQTQEQPKTRQEKRQERREEKAQAKSEREIGADVRRVQEHLDKQLAGKSVQEQTAIRDKLVQQYGEAIAPAVYSAVRTNAYQQAAQNANPTAIQAAKEAALEGVIDQDMRRAVSSAYDQAAVDLALQTKNTDALGRYYQQLRGTGTGTMTMEAIVKGQDGQETRSTITGMSEDGKSVTLADGSTVAVKELQADADTMDIIHEISALGLGKNADKVFQAYKKSGKAGLDGYRWIMDYTTAIDQGRNRRISLQEAIKRSSLDAETVMEAYEMGHKETMDETRKAVQKNENRPKRKGVTGRVANIDTSAIQNEPMSKQEREQFDLANQIFEILGVDVKWESSKTRNGKYVGANGSYLNGAITLDIHAGRNDVIRDINSGILATTGHELTHFLQEYAPEQYQALKEFVLQQIVKNGKYGEATLDRMIQDKQNRSSKKLTKSQAEDEVVADACQTMLRDSKALREFAEQKPEAAKGVIRWLADWFKKIKAAFSRSAQLSEQARFMEKLEKDVREAFGKLWNDALREAVRVHDEIGNMESGDNAQNSDRDTAYLEAVERGDMETAQRMVDEAAKAGGWTIHAYHGTGRADRVGTVFRPERATSGPMAYFTDSKEIADHYAKDKKDTSLAYDPDYDSYETQFRVKTQKGAKFPFNYKIASAWGYIDIAKRNEIREKAGQLRYDWDGDDDNAFILAPGNKEANGGFQWQLKEAKGNVIKALMEQWLNSGNLFNEEARFLEVLKMVGITDELKRVGLDVEYKDPLYREEKTYDVFLKIKRPFVTSKVNNRFIENFLKWADKQPYGKYERESQSADLWDKNDVTAEDFAERLRDDMANDYTHAWTAVPDIVTDYLKHLGYDGIQDQGGKFHEEKHTVYIPFSSEQVKSAEPVTYDDSGNPIPLSERFNQENDDIRYSERDYSTPSDLELMEQAAEEWDEGRWNELLKDEAGDVRERLETAAKSERKLRDLQRKFEKLQADIQGFEGEGASRIAVKDFTRNVLDSFGIPSGQRTEVGQLLQSLTDYLLAGNHVNRADILPIFEGLVQSGKRQLAADDALANIREDLKGRRIYVDKTVREEFGDDYEAFRRRAFGLGITLTGRNTDTGIDTVNAEMAEGYPGSFDASETDLKAALENIVNTAESGKTSTVSLLEALAEEERTTGTPVREQLQDMLDQFTRQIEIFEDRAKLERKARAGDAAEIAKLKSKAHEAANKLSEMRKERDALRRKVKNADNAKQKAVDDALRKLVVRDAKQLAEAVRQKQELADKLAEQIKREKQIVSGALKPPAMQKLLKAVREEAAEKATAHKEEVFQRYKERKNETELRGRIRNLRNELVNRMAKPTDRVYVPAELAQSLVDVLDVLDASPKQGTKAAAKYDSVTESLRELASEYGNLSLEKNNQIPYEFKSEYMQEVADEIDALAKAMKGRNIRELTLDELQKVYDVVKQIRDTMRDATKMIGQAGNVSIYDPANEIIANQTAIRTVKNSKTKSGRWINSAMSTVNIDALSAMRAALMIGGYDENSAEYKLWKEIENGLGSKNAILMENMKRLQPLISGKNELTYLKALNEKADYGIRDEKGKPVLMTKLQAIQTYMTWQREQANNKVVHMTEGGVVFRDHDLISKGKYDLADQTKQKARVTLEDIANIEGKLTEWDKAYIKACREVFDDLLKKSNDVLYALKHKVHKGEKNYIPEKVAEDYLQREVAKGGEFNLGIKEPGATKDLVQRSTLPIIIDGMDTLLNRHIHDMSNYIGLAIPIRNFAKVFNVRTKGIGIDATTVNGEIGNTWGEKANNMMLDTLRELQNGKTYEYTTNMHKWESKLQEAFVKASLVGKISVFLKQAASYAAAGSVLSQKALDLSQQYIYALVTAPNSKLARRLYAKIDALTPEHWIRRQGMSMEEIAMDKLKRGPVKDKLNTAGAWLEGKGKPGQMIRRTGSMLNPTNWIQRMDVATTGALFVACEKQAKYDGFKTGTAEYESHVKELYERVIHETQPMYDALHRPELQKNAPPLAKLAMPFRTVPFQNYGQIMTAVGTFQSAMRDGTTEQKKTAAKHLGKTLWANFESAAVFALLGAFAYGLRHKPKRYLDDDEELTLESALKTYFGDVLDVSLGNLLPYGGSELKDIIERFSEGNKWYDAFSVGALDLANETIKSAVSLWEAGSKLSNGEISADQFKSTFVNASLQFSKIMGLPASNIYEIGQGISADVSDILNGKLTIERSTAVNVRRYMKAILSGDQSKADQVMDEMRRNILADKPDMKEDKVNDKITGAIRSYLKEQYLDSDMSESAQKTAVSYLLKYGGKDTEKDAWDLVRRWEEGEAHKGDDEYSFSVYSDFLADIDAGDSFETAAAEYLEHGYKEDALRSEVVKHGKARYLDGDMTKEEAIEYLQKYRDWDYNASWLKVREWEESADYTEEDGGWSKYDSIRAAIDANQDISGIVAELTAHGVKEEDIRKEAKEHISKQFVDGKISEDKFKNWLARYCGITHREDAAEIVNDAKCKRDTGYTVEKLGEGYRAGDVGKTDVKNALTRYGGLTGTDADKKIRWWDQQKLHPDLQITEGACNNWYDGSAKTRENGHESAKAAGMSLQAYLAAKKELDKISDANGNSTGEDEYIAALAKMNLTPRQKDALYYEKYKGTTKYSTAKSW